MKREPRARVAPAPHNPKNVPKSCWTCLHRGPTTADWCYCRRSGKDQKRANIEPCEHYDLDSMWLEVDWLYL